MVVVVGAGPAGLATAYYLQQRKIPYTVLEKGGIGYAWQKHYDSLRLHTLKQLSALPGLPVPDSYPDFPTKDQFLTYLQDYARHFDLNIEVGVEVKQATCEKGVWHLQTNRGEWQAEKLVVATGIWSTPYWPIFGGEASFEGTILHAKDYRNPQPFVGQRVLVVGAGNTGTEIAVELSEHGVETGIVVRSGVNFVDYPRSPLLFAAATWFLRHAPKVVGNWLLRLVRPNFSNLGIPPHPDPPTEAFPVVGFELPEVVAAGAVTVYGEIDHLIAGGVCFKDGQEVTFDTIILATGYRPTMDFIDPAPELDGRGRIRRNGRHSYPNLYTVGFHYPATEGWLQAIGRVARCVANKI